MNIIDPEIEKYLEEYSEDEPEVLKKLNRETHAKVLMPRMLSGRVQGRLLSLLSKIVKPLNILEIGTFTGYSAICLAEGLQPGGMVHTIDINEELEDMVAAFISEAGMRNRVKQYIGNALEIIPNLDLQFDLIFIDADKINYVNYYKMVKPRLKSGGLILADNVLWSGKVVGESRINKDTQAILDFNTTVKTDPEVEKVILPLRDGLTLIRKK